MVIEQKFHQIKAVDSSDLKIELKELIKEYSENDNFFPLLKQVVKTGEKNYLVVIDLHKKEE